MTFLADFLHTDSFKVVTNDASQQVDHIAGYFLIKLHDPRSYYLGNDCNYHDVCDIWTYTDNTYTMKEIRR